MSQSILIPTPALTDFAAALFVAAGVGIDEARGVASALVASNLCGHDSHGVVHIPGYMEQLANGDVVPGAAPAVVQETESLVVADAGRGFGPVQIIRLIDKLVPKAKKNGIACGAMRNSAHVGRLGAWVELAARLGFAALMTVNDNGVLQCVAPPGGTEPRLSTNPLAVAVPTGNGALVLDMSTSAVAQGKVRLAHLGGHACPPGWLLDAQGNPTTDPAVRFQEPAGTILPMGGEQGFKGFGLALLLDILVGGLTGGTCPPAAPDDRLTNNVLLVLWDPAAAAGREHFNREANKLIDYVRATKRKAGVAEIRLPGDRSHRTTAQRAADGIPLDAGVWKSLTDLAAKLQVPVPQLRT